MPKPEETQTAPQIDSSDISEILGAATAQLIDLVARRAQAKNLTLYLVGGVVRDLLLKRPNLDLDFVLESDAIRFARALADAHGGALRSHQAFATATWTLDAAAATSLSLNGDDMPDHLDFARARSETYAYPTALPTVAPSSIAEDLWRRDFAFNALALQLSPARSNGKLLDVCGGLSDIQQKRIRVLHDRSFVDDPTRILRAMRFSARYQFQIERTTAELMRDALPMLARVTGARLRSEIDMILQERSAAEILPRLQDLGALRSIQPAFRVSSRLEQRLPRLREAAPGWVENTINERAIRWCLLLADSGEGGARAICQRLDLSSALTRSVTECARLVAAENMLGDRGIIRPSQITRLLDGAAEGSLIAAWMALSHSPGAQRSIDDYAGIWRHQRPGVTGDDLKRRGIAPGPRYKTILEAIRSAWIDGDIVTLEEEAAYLEKLLARDD